VRANIITQYEAPSITLLISLGCNIAGRKKARRIPFDNNLNLQRSWYKKLPSTALRFGKYIECSLELFDENKSTDLE
jgi:hypothetical protein